MIIDLSENPNDLRPAINAIIHRLQAKLEDVTENNALVVVVFGEIHPVISHVALKSLVLSRLCELRKQNSQSNIANFFLAYEDEFDLLEKDFITYTGKSIPQEAYEKIYRSDEYSKLLINSLIVKDTPYAPVSKLNLFHFCLQNDVMVHCVDVALDGIYLSSTDPLAAEVYKRHYNRDLNQSRISASSVTGIAIRNKVMATRTIEHAREINARVALLSCGQIHVFGQRAINGHPEFPYQDSLVNQFKEMGIATINIYHDQSSDNWLANA